MPTTWVCTPRRLASAVSPGNFPQAFTHLALISAAINLDKALLFHRGGGNFLSAGTGNPRDRAHDLAVPSTQNSGRGDASSVVAPQPGQGVGAGVTPAGIAPQQVAPVSARSSHAVETRRDAGIETNTGGNDLPAHSGSVPTA